MALIWGPGNWDGFTSSGKNLGFKARGAEISKKKNQNNSQLHPHMLNLNLVF